MKKDYTSSKKIEQILSKYFYHKWNPILDGKKLKTTENAINGKEYGIAYLYNLKYEKQCYYMGYYYLDDPKTIYELDLYSCDGNLLDIKTGKPHLGVFGISSEKKLGDEKHSDEYESYNYVTISKKKYNQEYDAFINSLPDWSDSDYQEEPTMNEQQDNHTNNSNKQDDDLSNEDVYSIAMEFWGIACSKVNKNCKFVNESSVRRTGGTYDAVFYVYIANEHAYKYLTIRFMKGYMGEYKFFDAHL